MDHSLKIFIDRLEGGKVERFNEELSTDFLDCDISFHESVTVKGKAYLAEDHLVIQLQVKVVASLELKDFYHTEELGNIRGAIYDMQTVLRETILLEIPSFIECHGNCPKRNELNKYLSNNGVEETIQYPFADLTKIGE